MEKRLSLSIIFQGIDRLTAPLRSISKASAVTSRDLGKIRGEIGALERTTGKLRGFRDLQGSLAKNLGEMDETRRRIKGLQADIAQTGKPTREMTAQLRDAERHLAKLGKTAETQAAKIQDFRSDLSKAGVNVLDLANEEDRLAHSLTGATRKLEQQQRQYERMQTWQRRANRMSATGEKLQSVGARAVTAGTAAAIPTAFAIKPAIDFESAMADVRKVVNVTKPELEDLKKKIEQLSFQVPISPEQIAGIVAFGARSGIARDELLAFANDAAKMGVAFDMMPEEAGATMAKWRVAFKMSQGDVRGLGDKVNALTNAFGGTASEVSEIITRIGPLGQVTGTTAASIAAMAQLLNSLGVESEIGATGIKNMTLALTKGDGLAKRQQESLKKLGFNAQDLAKRMQVDSKGTVLAVFERISKLQKSQQAGVLTNLFGTESVAAIAPLLSNLDRLKQNFALVGDEAKWSGSMMAEFANRSDTSGNKLQLAKNHVMVMTITLGEKLLPYLIIAADKIGAIADKVTEWANRHPKLAGALETGALATIAMMVALGGLSLIIGTIFKPLSWLIRLLPMLGIGRAAAGEAAGGVSRIGAAAEFVRKMFGRLRGAASTLGPILRKVGNGVAPQLLEGFGGMAKSIPAALGRIGPALVGSRFAGLLVRGVMAGFGLLSNPVGWTILAVAAAGLIWHFRDKIKDVWNNTVGPFFSNAWKKVSSYISSIDWGETGRKVVRGIAFGLSFSWTSVKTWFSDSWTSLKTTVTNIDWHAAGKTVMDALDSSMHTGMDAMKAWWQPAWDNMREAVKTGDWGKIGVGIADAMTFGLASKLKSSNWQGLFKSASGAWGEGWSAGAAAAKGPAKPAAPKPVPIAGKRAKGGPVGAGRLYLVGEQGPELFQAPTSGNIIPNDRLRRPAGRIAAVALAATPLAAAATPVQQLPAAISMPQGANLRSPAQLRIAASIAAPSAPPLPATPEWNAPSSIATPVAPRVPTAPDWRVQPSIGPMVAPKMPMAPEFRVASSISAPAAPRLPSLAPLELLAKTVLSGEATSLPSASMRVTPRLDTMPVLPALRSQASFASAVSPTPAPPQAVPGNQRVRPGSAAAGLGPERGGDTFHITIQQQPGEDGEALVRRMMDMIKREKRNTSRGAYSDD